MNRRLTLPLALLLSCLTLAVGFGAEPKPENPAPDARAKDKEKEEEDTGPPEPVHVWGDRIRYVASENLARVTGKVTIIRKNLRIDADLVNAILDPETNQFKKIIARGHVLIHSVEPIEERTRERPGLQLQKELRKAVCEVANYDPANEIVVLTGTPAKQPMVWINQDQVQADLVTYDHKADLMHFKGRVKLSALTPVRDAAGETKEGEKAGGEKKPGE